MKIKVDVTSIPAAFAILFCNAGMVGFIKGSVAVTLLAYGSVLLWMILAVKNDKKLLYTFLSVSGIVVAFSALINVCRPIANSAVLRRIGLMSNNILFLLVFVMMAIYYSAPHRQVGRRMIVIAWFIDTVIASIYTIYRLIENPILSRVLATDSERASLEETVSVAGVLGYGSIYGLTLVVIALSGVLSKGKDYSKIWIIGCSVLFAYTIIQAQFFIAVMVSVIGIVTCILFGREKITKNNLISWLVIVITVLIVGFTSVSWLPQLITGGVLPSFVADRLEMFFNGITTSELMTTDRGIVYLQTITAIVHTRGMGILFIGDSTTGGHTEILDLIAVYGVFLSAIFIYGMWRIKQYISTVIPTTFSRHYNIVWIMYVVISFLNTSLWCTTTLDLLLIIPLMYIEFQSFGAREDLHENCIHQP